MAEDAEIPEGPHILATLAVRARQLASRECGEVCEGHTRSVAPSIAILLRVRRIEQALSSYRQATHGAAP